MITRSLAEYQESIRAALAADPLFAAVLVRSDDGMTLWTQEKAFADKGVALIVSPVLTLRRADDARAALLCVATYAVHIRTNPKVNLNGTTGVGIDPHEAVTACIRAVIAAHRDPSGTREFVRAAASLAEIVAEDSGLLTYSVLFDASVQLSVN